jgi:hypothetical protein
LTSDSRLSSQPFLMVSTQVYTNLGLDSTAHSLLTVVHPQLSAGGWPLKHSIPRFGDQSLAARNVATKLRMHDVCSDLRTSSTIGWSQLESHPSPSDLAIIGWYFRLSHQWLKPPRPAIKLWMNDVCMFRPAHVIDLRLTSA